MLNIVSKFVKTMVIEIMTSKGFPGKVVANLESSISSDGISEMCLGSLV